MWVISLICAIGMMVCCIGPYYYMTKKDVQLNYDKTILWTVLGLNIISVMIFVALGTWSIYSMVYPIERQIYYEKSSSNTENMRVVRTKKCHDYALMTDECYLVKIERTPFNITFGEPVTEDIKEN